MLKREDIRIRDPFILPYEGKYYLYGTFIAVGMAESETGSVYGPWKHLPKLLFEKNGGHGMLFTGFNGKRYFTLHSPNSHPLERANFYEVSKEEGRFILK